MSAHTAAHIDFAVLDDVLLAPQDRHAMISGLLASRSIHGIGPALEYAFQQARFASILPALQGLPQSPVTSALMAAMAAHGKTHRLQTTLLEPAAIEFAALRNREALPHHAGWDAYLKRLQGAAARAGFGKTIAAGLAGAVGELVDNLDTHSNAPRSGMVGYAFGEDLFEFVIADTGIGVLASLQQCADYAHLDDHGDALRTALTDGESRFGRGSNHGLGFRQIFVAIADLYGSLRFRSGDARLEIEGAHAALPAALIAQTACFKGFMAFFACRRTPPQKNA